ncbi:MAG: hypothetical protein AAF939_15825 [Planctomycetota bacterium]
MIRKAIAMLSLCCLILCGFVASLSYKEMRSASRLESDSGQTFTCKQLLSEHPLETTRFHATQFAAGKHIVTSDYDDDGAWDQVLAPLFPTNEKLNISHGYQGLIVVFEKVDNQAEFDRLMEDQNLDVTYFAGRELDETSYSRLAMKYKRLDIHGSIVCYYGLPDKNPLLNAETFEISKVAAAGLGLIFVVSLLSTFIKFKRKPKTASPEKPLVDPRKNRAGLPPLRRKAPTSTFLDH